MLSDFGFLDLFSERGSVAGAVTTGAADFLCAFGHREKFGGGLVGGERSVEVVSCWLADTAVTVVSTLP